MPGSPNVPVGDALELPDHDPERLVILQYTSGSTSEPKGVMIPDRVLTANIDACCDAAVLTEGDTMVSWLPPPLPAGSSFPTPGSRASSVISIPIANGPAVKVSTPTPAPSG